MKPSDEKLKLFGDMVSLVSQRLHITVDAISQDMHISTATFANVWKGIPVSIIYYRNIFRYLYDEADERTKRMMIEQLTKQFTT